MCGYIADDEVSTDDLDDISKSIHRSPLISTQNSSKSHNEKVKLQKKYCKRNSLSERARNWKKPQNPFARSKSDIDYMAMQNEEDSSSENEQKDKIIAKQCLQLLKNKFDTDEESQTSQSNPEEEDNGKFPNEYLKFFLSIIFLCFSAMCSLISLAIIHDHIPPRNTTKSLPDITLSYFEEIPWAVAASEYIIMVTVLSTIVLLFFHKHHWIVIRRAFLVVALVYFMRAFAMSFTLFPIASKYQVCSPQMRDVDALTIVKRMASMFLGLGFTINGRQKFCGDCIYSGHSAILIICWLFINEYTKNTKFWYIHFVYLCLAVAGTVLLLLGYGHYTIDIVLAYYASTRTFWIYHHLCNNPEFKKMGEYNYFSNIWWFWGFYWFEKNVKDVVPNLYGWPFTWPKQ